MDQLESEYLQGLHLEGSYHKRRNAIRKVFDQQTRMHTKGKYVPGRIVSVHKITSVSYCRGKESKAIEFSAKTNLVQKRGLNFIKHISFKAFNEGTRGISSIQYAQMLFCRKVNNFPADAVMRLIRPEKLVTAKAMTKNDCAKDNVN